MPRNGKQKERLTKREIRRLRNIIAYNEGKTYFGEACDEPEEKLPGYCEYEDTGNSLPSELFVSQNRFTQHIRAFIHFNPDVRYLDLGSVRLAFMNKKDRDAYDAWYDEYIQKFGEAPGMSMPPPTDGIYPYIEPASSSTRRIPSFPSAVGNASKGSSASPHTEYDNWLWIMENCESEVRYAGNHFYFSNSSDAALYRLSRT